MPSPGKKTLRDLRFVEFLTLAEVGERYEVSRQRVQQWYAVFDIDTRWIKHRKLQRVQRQLGQPSDWIKQLYLGGMNCNQIARHLVQEYHVSISTGAIEDWLHDERARGHLSGLPICRDEFTILYSKTSLPLGTIAEHFGVSYSTICRWRKICGLAKRKEGSGRFGQ